MKRNPIQIFLVIAVSTFILVSPTYPRSPNLGGASHLSADLSFESPDQDDIFSDQPGQAKAFLSTTLTTKSLPEAILFDQISRFLLLASFPDHKASILRC
jgi:hypothetical protein